MSSLAYYTGDLGVSAGCSVAAGMNPFPCLVRSVAPSNAARYILGDPLVDRYLEFVARCCRPNRMRVGRSI